MKKITRSLLSLLLVISMVTVNYIFPIIQVFALEQVSVTIDVNGGNELEESTIYGQKGSTLTEILMEQEESIIISFMRAQKPRTYLLGLVNSANEEPIDPEKDPINEDIVIKMMWGNSELYSGDIEIEASPPIIGEEYSLHQEIGDFGVGLDVQDPSPALETNFEVFDVPFVDRSFMVRVCDDDLDEHPECLQKLSGTIQEGVKYYLSFYIGLNDNYYMTNDVRNVLTVNGEVPTFESISEEDGDFKGAWILMEMDPVESSQSNPDPQSQQFKVEFDTDGGSGVDSVFLADGDVVPRPENDPTKPNYVFAGWYFDDQRTIEYDFGDPVHENRTVFAKWIEKSISIVANPNTVNFGNILVNPSDYIERNVSVENTGNVCVSLTIGNPTKSGPFGTLGFSSVNINPGESQDVTLIVNKYNPKVQSEGSYEGDYVITANECDGDGETSVNVHASVNIVEPTPVTHKVEFDTDGGTPIDDVIVNDGEKVARPDVTPQKDNYEFEEWCADETKTQPYNFDNAVSEDITIYARYREVVQGGGNEPSSASIVVTPNNIDFGTLYVGSKSDLYESVKVTNDSQVDVEVTVSSPTNEGPFYALEIDPFVVEAGEEVNVSLIVDHGAEKASVPGTYYGQYVFSYNEVGVAMGDEALVSATVKVEEAPTPEKVKVIFDADGGSPVPASVELDKGTAVARPTENPQKENYTFDTWCADETKTQEYDFSQPVNGDITLYARYNEVKQGNGNEEPSNKLEILDNTDNQDYDPSSDSDGLTIRVSGELSDLVKIEVDGVVVADKDVVLTSGSTIATFTKEFLSTLSAGAHTVTFYYGSGNISTTVTVKAQSTQSANVVQNTNNPKTGDNIALWFKLLGVSAVGMVILRKKH